MREIEYFHLVVANWLFVDRLTVFDSIKIS